MKREKAGSAGPVPTEAPPGTESVPGETGGNAKPASRGYLHLHPENPGRPSLVDPGVLEESRRFPTLSEFLTVTAIDGVKREPSSLILFVEAGYPKVCLSDRHFNRVAFSTAGSFLEALEALEENLEAGLVDWRAKKPWKGK